MIYPPPIKTHPAAQYIGLKFCAGGRSRETGVDCWGLVRLYYEEQKGIILPDLPGITNADILGISRTIVQESHGPWKEISRPEDGCAVGMSLRTLLHHVGIWIEVDGGKVLHCWEGGAVVAESLRMLRLKGIKIIKFFTYGLDH